MPDSMYDPNDTTGGTAPPPLLGSKAAWDAQMKGTTQGAGAAQNQGQQSQSQPPMGQALGGLAGTFAAYLAQRQAQAKLNQGYAALPGQLPAPPNVQTPIPPAPTMNVPGRYSAMPFDPNDPNNQQGTPQ